MKKIVFFFSLFFFSAFSFAQKLIPEPNGGQNPLYGYVGTNSGFVIPPKYEFAGNFDKKTKAAIVQKGDKVFLINNKGEKISGDYDKIPEVYSDLAVFGTEALIFPVFLGKQGKFYAVDIRGKELGLTFDKVFVDDDAFYLFLDKKSIFCKKNDQYCLFDLKNNEILGNAFFDRNLILPFQAPTDQLNSGMMYEYFNEGAKPFVFSSGKHYFLMDNKGRKSAEFDLDSRMYSDLLYLNPSFIIVKRKGNYTILNTKDFSFSRSFSNYWMLNYSIESLEMGTAVFVISDTTTNLSFVYDQEKDKIISRPFVFHMPNGSEIAEGLVYPSVKKGFDHAYFEGRPTSFAKDAELVDGTPEMLARESYFLKEKEQWYYFSTEGLKVPVEDYRIIKPNSYDNFFQVKVKGKWYVTPYLFDFFAQIQYEGVIDDDIESDFEISYTQPVVYQSKGGFGLLSKDLSGNILKRTYSYLVPVATNAYIASNEKGFQGIIDSSGHELLPFTYRFIVPGQDTFIAYNDQGYSFLKLKNSEIINPSAQIWDDFDEAGIINDGIDFLDYSNQGFVVRKDGKSAVLNADFEVIIPADAYVSIESLRQNNCFLAQTKNGQHYILNEKGRRINTEAYSNIYYYHGVFIVKKDQFYGVLANDGSLVCDFIFERYDTDYSNKRIKLTGKDSSKELIFDKDWNCTNCETEKSNK